MLKSLVKTAHKYTGYNFDSLVVEVNELGDYEITIKETHVARFKFNLTKNFKEVKEISGRLSNLGWSHDKLIILTYLAKDVIAGIELAMKDIQGGSSVFRLKKCYNFKNNFINRYSLILHLLVT